MNELQLLCRQQLRPFTRPALLYAATVISFASITTLTSPGETSFLTGMCLILTGLTLAMLTGIATMKALHSSPTIQQTLKSHPSYVVISFLGVILSAFIIGFLSNKIGDFRLQHTLWGLSVIVIGTALTILVIFSTIMFKLKPSNTLTTNKLNRK